MPSGRAVTFSPDADLPDWAAREISYLAAKYVRRLAPKSKRSGRHAASYIRPTYRQGEVGVHLPPAAHYLWFQNAGTKPFVMRHLEGKTIPIRGSDGKMHFRVARNVGKPRITVRDDKGRIVASEIAWRHPGIKPKRFIEKGVEMAVLEWRKSLSFSKFVRLYGHMIRTYIHEAYREWKRRP